MKKVICLTLLFILSQLSYAGSDDIKVNLKAINKINSKTYILTFNNPYIKGNYEHYEIEKCDTFTLTASYSYKRYMKTG